MNVIRVNTRFFALLLSAITLTALTDSPARLAVSGDSPLNRPGLSLLFTWNSILRAAGAGWTPGESVRIYLHGPLNSLAVFPDAADRLGVSYFSVELSIDSVP